MGILETLKGKVGGIPVWLIAVIGTGVLTFVLIRKKSSQDSATQAAADQTSTDLGSAAELPNFFDVSGLMPYQGGDVYVTQTNNPGNTGGTVSQPPPVTTPPSTGGVTTPKPPATAKPLEYKVKKGDTLTSIAKKYGLTATQLYDYNIGTGSKGANRPASTIATLKSRGPNLLYSNETIDIPKKGTVFTGGY